MARESRVYAPHERPDIEVLVDGVWHRGELRAWQPDPDGEGWRANVQYRPEKGVTYIDTVAEERVRPDPRGSDR
jgi:hypothetical protein